MARMRRWTVLIIPPLVKPASAFLSVYPSISRQSHHRPRDGNPRLPAALSYLVLKKSLDSLFAIPVTSLLLRTLILLRVLFEVSANPRATLESKLDGALKNSSSIIIQRGSYLAKG